MRFFSALALSNPQHGSLTQGLRAARMIRREKCLFFLSRFPRRQRHRGNRGRGTRGYPQVQPFAAVSIPGKCVLHPLWLCGSFWLSALLQFASWVAWVVVLLKHKLRKILHCFFFTFYPFSSFYGERQSVYASLPISGISPHSQIMPSVPSERLH